MRITLVSFPSITVVLIESEGYRIKRSDRGWTGKGWRGLESETWRKGKERSEVSSTRSISRSLGNETTCVVTKTTLRRKTDFVKRAGKGRIIVTH